MSNNVWPTLIPFTKEVKEKTVQSIFENWNNGRNGFLFAGVPEWLNRSKYLDGQKRILAVNVSEYPYIPDVVFYDEKYNYVIELKCAEKMEEIGLSEVLHHAHQLNRFANFYNTNKDKVFIPVLVNTNGAWNRSALKYLFDNGFRKSAFRYLEFSFLKMNNEKYFVFEEPFAIRKPLPEPPDWFPVDWKKLNLFVYQYGESASWLVTNESLEADEIRIPDQCAIVSGVDLQAGKFVIWARGKKFHGGEYYLYDTSVVDSGLMAPAIFE